MLWLLIVLLSAAVLGLFAWTFRRPGQASGEASDLAVYRDQLAELDRDVARGLIPETEAGAARLEIQRRLLAAADSSSGKAGAKRRAIPRAAMALPLLLPLAALGLYLGLGHPELPGSPFASRGQPTGNVDPQLVAMVDRLAQHMKAKPEDIQGWLLLGRAEGDLGRYQESAAAYGQAIARGQAAGSPPTAELQSHYGEALAAAAGGQVTPAAKTAFAAALALDAKEPRSRFYLALAEAQAGHVDKALQEWVALEADTPSDAPWLPMLTSRIEAAAKQLGRDPATLPGRKAGGIPPAQASTDTGAGAAGTGAPDASPSAADIAKAAAMTPEQRKAFIDSMVAGLAAKLQQNPDDIDGWLRLANAYDKLGEPDQAEAAWREAATRAPDRLEAQLDYAAAIASKPDQASFPPDFAPTVERIRKLAPDNGLGLYCAGLIARAQGDKATARMLWQKVLALTPAGSPQHQELQNKIDALGP
jgi:cytochrome c-type biogenesis protein CcmH